VLYGALVALCPGGLWSALEATLAQAPPGLVLDIGAYDGSDAIAYAKAGHEVMSFEPVPFKVERIRAAIAESGVGSRISFHNMAMSNFTGTAPFQVMDNLARDKGELPVGSEQDGFFVPWKGGRSVDVKVDTIDKMVGDREVLFMKIDAQGHDPMVLRGAERLLREHRVDAFAFEVTPRLTPEPSQYHDVLRWLHDLGYVCADCKYFKGAGLRGKTGRLAVARAGHYLDRLHDTFVEHRGGNHGAHTEFVCTHTELPPRTD